MEFHEKLQELRKNRGLTQEELAEALFVSRTAISKWESGRGYPNIDSLKELANFFSVTIDELLSGDKLLSVVEQENKYHIRAMCDFLFGVMDLLAVSLVVLPLYPHTVNGFVYSVNLFSYSEIKSMNRSLYWGLFLSLVVIGFVKILLTKCGNEKNSKRMTWISMGLSILIVLFLAMTREAYALSAVFLLLITKGILLLRYSKAGG